MKTAQEMYDYCMEKNYGEGVNRKWGLRHFGIIENALGSDESVLMCFMGLHNYESMTKHENNYAYAITDKRIIFAQKRVIGEEVKSVFFDKINDVSHQKGMLLGTITIDSLGETFNVGMSKQHIANIGEEIHLLLHGAKRSNSQPQNDASSNLPDVAEEILKFKDLLDKGILTQDEFNAKKKQLLDL